MLTMYLLGMTYTSCGENQGWEFSCMSGEATNTGKKFPRESQKAHSHFPMNGLAGIVKNNFPMSGEAANGEILFYYDC